MSTESLPEPKSNFPARAFAHLSVLVAGASVPISGWLLFGGEFRHSLPGAAFRLQGIIVLLAALGVFLRSKWGGVLSVVAATYSSLLVLLLLSINANNSAKFAIGACHIPYVILAFFLGLLILNARVTAFAFLGGVGAILLSLVLLLIWATYYELTKNGGGFQAGTGWANVVGGVMLIAFYRAPIGLVVFIGGSLLGMAVATSSTRLSGSWEPMPPPAPSWRRLSMVTIFVGTCGGSGALFVGALIGGKLGLLQVVMVLAFDILLFAGLLIAILAMRRREYPRRGDKISLAFSGLFLSSCLLADVLAFKEAMPW
jgi:hypothetical protein